MLRKLRELRTYRLHATDGDIGHLEQFYFDDRDWKIRYFVVDIGTWLHGKKVLMFGEPPCWVRADRELETTDYRTGRRLMDSDQRSCSCCLRLFPD